MQQNVKKQQQPISLFFKVVLVRNNCRKTLQYKVKSNTLSPSHSLWSFIRMWTVVMHSEVRLSRKRPLFQLCVYLSTELKEDKLQHPRGNWSNISVGSFMKTDITTSNWRYVAWHRPTFCPLLPHCPSNLPIIRQLAEEETHFTPLLSHSLSLWDQVLWTFKEEGSTSEVVKAFYDASSVIRRLCYASR